MSLSLQQFPRLSKGDDIRVLDGLVAAGDAESNDVVTSPNAEYVPKLPHRRVHIYMVADGTYGAFDPVCWPQVYHPDFAYFAAVPKMVAAAPPHNALWHKPTAKDCQALQGVPARNFGSLTDDFLRPFGTLTAELEMRVTAHTTNHPSTGHTQLIHHQCVVQQTYERLRHIPATLRDHQVQVSLFCRHWLLAFAYMRFADLEVAPEGPTSVKHDLMGAWTDNAGVVLELYQRGIPVWYVRNLLYVPSDTRIGSEVEFTPPPVAYANRMCHTPVYNGPVGYHSLLATQRPTQLYYDVCRIPTCLRTVDSALNIQDPSASTPSALGSEYPACRLVSLNPVEQPSQKPHPSQSRHGRDKFKEIEHSWMPPSIPSWQRALSEVDRSGKAREAKERWPYWIPEPALMVGSKEEFRQLRYLMNWVRVRPIWLSLLPSRRLETVTPQHWRFYLNSVPVDSKTDPAYEHRASHIKGLFDGILHVNDIEPANNGRVDWHGYSFTTGPPKRLCPWILWEAHELAFRHELLALDRACRSPGGLVEEIQAQDRVARVFSGLGLWSVTHLPDADEPGLFAAVPHRRIHALNALRDVVVHWLGCPQPLKDVDALTTVDDAATVEAFEYWVATFYVRTFFLHAGRPPILPHFLPAPP